MVYFDGASLNGILVKKKHKPEFASMETGETETYSWAPPRSSTLSKIEDSPVLSGLKITASIVVGPASHGVGDKRLSECTVVKKLVTQLF